MSDLINRLYAKIERLEGRAERAEALLRESRINLLISTKCVNPQAPVHRQLMQNVDAINAALPEV
jgi:hypothetical protein